MKKLLYIFASGFAFFSCLDPSSLLDKENVGDLDHSAVFENHIYVNRFLAEIYYNLTYFNGDNLYEHGSGWNGAYLDCATDNGEARHLESAAQKINAGNWNAADLPINSIWARNYAQIRACNRILEAIDEVPLEGDVFTPHHRLYIRAEATYLRAYYYYVLLRSFGGVPIVTEVLDPDSDEAKQLSRNTFAQTVDFIVEECDAAARLFEPLHDITPVIFPIHGAGYGRANIGTSLALKAKTLLLAASPLFNRNPADPSHLRYDDGDPNLELWRYPDYDRERWKLAADACKEVIDLGYYDLVKVGRNTKTAYETIFTERAPASGNMREGIFTVLKGASISIFHCNLPFNFMPISGKDSPKCYNLPTHDLVMSYEMSNGMLPEQSGSGYRPLNPTADRDPRLRSTIWHDGAEFCGIKFNTWRRESISAKNNGKDYITGHSRTGYFLRKYMDIDQNPSHSGVSVPNSFFIIRYADILLSYAEALNEYHNAPTDNTQIEWAIDQVRDRAGMPGLITTFANRGWGTPDKENTRNLIRNERRVEFAFEEHRFWDIRRWMIGEQTQKVVHELDIVLRDDDITKDYTVKKIENRAWGNHMNILPLPQPEINKNPNLVQNWGWTPAMVH